MSEKTQREIIREALDRGERLTHFDAEKHYGVMRLAAVIYKLKNPPKPDLRKGLKPMDIKTRLVEAPTRYRGGTSTVAQYWVEVKRGQLSLI